MARNGLAVRRDAGAEHDIVEHGHVAERPHDLVGQRETAADPRCGGIAGDIDAAERDPAAIGPLQPGDDLDQRGLAGAVRPDQADEITFLDGKGHAGDGLHAAEADRDVVELQRGAHARLARVTRLRAIAASPPGASRITSTSRPPKTSRR